MNIKIRSIRVQHPMDVVDNHYFINLFKKQGKDIQSLLNAFGKKERKIIKDSSDNTLTLGIKAALKVLKTSGLTGKDIDMIVFSSQFPEYTAPTQALMVHHAIKGKTECMVMDMNVNCVGMLVALDNTARYLMQKKHFSRALIIGSDYMTIHCKKNDELTYPMFGDCAVAMIIEKSEDDCGVIGSIYKTNSDFCDAVKYPSCGLSSLYKDDITMNDRKLLWSQIDASNNNSDSAVGSVKKLLSQNNLHISQIKAFCFSQFALSSLKACAAALGVSEEKFIYIGDEYGYTGTSSPFLALYEGIKRGQIQRGDYVILWTIGINWTTCATLLKY